MKVFAQKSRAVSPVQGEIQSALSDYVTLFKPGIVSLVLVSTLTGIYLAGRGVVDLPTVLWAIGGVGLATAGSAALNNFFDRDIDSLMKRTSKRGLVTGTIPPAFALFAGLFMVMGAMMMLSINVNMLSAALTMASVLIYVVAYAMILKRTSPLANQIGGIAGALPPVIGYAAMTGSVGIEAVALFFIVAIWQQPHALSLALKYKNDYARAGIPVIPVACGVPATKWRILLYTLALLPVSTIPYFIGMAGPIYLALAIVSGVIFIGLSYNFLRAERESNMFLFMYSVIYLTVVFLAMVMDLIIL